MATLGRTKAGLILSLIASGVVWPAIAQTPDVRPPHVQPTATAPEATAIRVDKTHFSGNASIPAEKLAEVVKPWMGLDLTLDDITAMANAVTAYYRAEGFLVAQTYVPRQVIVGHTVDLAVIEGTFSRIEVANTSRVSDERIAKTIAINACGQTDCHGQSPILRDKVERAGRLAAEIPGVAVTYQLKKGETPGTTSLVVDAKPAKRASVTLAADNNGFAYTGRERVSLGGSVSNVIGVGDLITANATYSGKGLRTYSAEASAPVGYRGARAGVTAGRLTYALGGAFQALGVKGRSDTVGVYASYPLQRNLKGSTDLRIDAVGRRIAADIATLGAHTKETAVEAVAALTGYHLDNSFKSGSTQYRLAITQGRLKLDDPASKAFDAGTARTAGGFTKVNYLVRREELITRGWSLFGQVNGQWAAQNLDSSEKFAVSGPAAVRAYGAGQVSSDIATVLTVESRVSLSKLVPGHQLVFAPFYDLGQAKFNAKSWAGYSGPRQTTLGGGGVYASLAKPGRYSLRATFAKRVNPPAALAKGRGYQAWFEAAAAF